MFAKHNRNNLHNQLFQDTLLNQTINPNLRFQQIRYKAYIRYFQSFLQHQVDVLSNIFDNYGNPSQVHDLNQIHFL